MTQFKKKKGIANKHSLLYSAGRGKAFNDEIYISQWRPTALKEKKTENV